MEKKLYGKVKEIRARIDDLKIKAPFDGFIGIRNYSEGSFIQPGEEITQIYDINYLKIQFFVPESYSDKIKIGEDFILDVESNKLKNISGLISVVDTAVDQQTRTFKVIGKIKNTNDKIKPGMMVNIKIPLEERTALLIRENSVLSKDDVSFVYVLDTNNFVTKK